LEDWNGQTNINRIDVACSFALTPFADEVRGGHGRCQRCRIDLLEQRVLATTKVEDFDRFLKIFSTKSFEKRKQYGCKGATVFRDPNENDRVWVVFDWDEKGWQSFASDPEVPPIMKEAGHLGKPQVAKLGAQYGA
jgi:hypothetical protein